MKVGEIRALGRDELLRKLLDFERELFNLRFQKAAGQLENPMKIKQTQRDIARIKTVLTEFARNPKETDN